MISSGLWGATCMAEAVGESWTGEATWDDLSNMFSPSVPVKAASQSNGIYSLST